MDYATMQRESRQYQDQMTDAERMSAYARGEEVDRIPYSLSSSDTLATLYGFTMNQFRTSAEVQIALAKYLKRDFGVNGVGVGLGLKRLGAALGSVLHYPENGTDYVVTPLISDYSTLETLEVVNPYENETLLKMLQKIKMYKDVFGNDFTISSSVGGPMTTAVSLRKTEAVLRDLLRDKENLHKLLDYSVRCSLAWVKAVYTEFGVTKIGIYDPATSLSLISASMFREFSKPHMADFVNGIIDITGKVPGLHICGKTKGIWEDLVELGFTSISVDDCEDLAEIKSAVGDRIAFSGNVPPVEVMRYGTIDDVIESVRQCLIKGSDNPKGYTLAIGCQIPAETPKENIEAYIFAAKKYGRGAQKGRLCKGIEHIL